MICIFICRLIISVQRRGSEERELGEVLLHKRRNYFAPVRRPCIFLRRDSHADSWNFSLSFFSPGCDERRNDSLGDPGLKAASKAERQKVLSKVMHKCGLWARKEKAIYLEWVIVASIKTLRKCLCLIIMIIIININDYNNLIEH